MNPPLRLFVTDMNPHMPTPQQHHQTLYWTHDPNTFAPRRSKVHASGAMFAAATLHAARARMCSPLLDFGALSGLVLNESFTAGMQGIAEMSGVRNVGVRHVGATSWRRRLRVQRGRSMAVVT